MSTSDLKTKDDKKTFEWLDDEVLNIYDLEKTTDTFINKDEQKFPKMIRYFNEITEKDLITIRKWLKNKDLKYMGLASTKKSADIDLILTWIEKLEKEDVSFEEEGIYKVIYLNVSGTLHQLNFNVGSFPEVWLENHRYYHLWNCHYNV